MDKEAVGTTGIGVVMAWLCNHIPEVQAFIIFGFTVVYLYWKIRRVRAETKKIEKDIYDNDR